MPVTLDARGLRVDGAPTPLIAGSMEYWRIISLRWRECLQAMRGAGLDLVSSFVCWDFHEVERGEFDFVGDTHPSRDLVGFIDACADEGFKFLLRVGPIIDAEWPTRGPAPDVCRLQRTDPVYRERTEEYLEALLEHITPRLAGAGGPIIMVAVDNEPYYPYATDDEADPSEGSIHVPYAKKEVLESYGDWLSLRYDGDDSLRKAWGDDSVSLSDPGEPDYDGSSSKAILDSFEFLTDMVAETYVWMRDFCRERGVNVPIYSNMKPLSQYIGWQQIEEEIVDSHGLGLFMSDMVPGEQALVTSWYIRLQRALTRFPWAAEFQSLAPMGQEEVFGILSDRHQRYITELSLALGLRGLSYYVFVERDDAYGAPISPLGKVRPRLDEVSKAIQTGKQLEADRTVAQVGLLWSYAHHRLAIADRIDRWENLHHVWIGMNSPQELPAWWEVFRELHEKDFDFAIVPMSNADPEPKVLIYAGPDEVRTSEFEKVVAAVEGGATLVTRSLPTRALDGDNEKLEKLRSRLEGTNRVLEPGKSRLDEALVKAGAEPALQANQPGVWTTAFESDSAYYLFIVNTTDEAKLTKVMLGAQLSAALRDLDVKDVATGAALEFSGSDLLGEGLELPAKSIRAIAATKQEDD